MFTQVHICYHNWQWLRVDVKVSFDVAFKLKVIEEAEKLPIKMLASQPDDEDDDPFANLDEPNSDENELETNELVMEDND